VAVDENLRTLHFFNAISVNFCLNPLYKYILLAMSIHLPIAVIGGTGKSGQYLVRSLLEHGHGVRMLVRSSSISSVENPKLAIIRGDARDQHAVQELLQGAQAVISTLGQPKAELPIFSDATRNVIQAMELFKMHRYIVTTGISVDSPIDQKKGYTLAATEWMKKNYPDTTSDKQREWRLLEASQMDWTLVRLPLIELTEEMTEVKTSLTDCPGEKISAGSLARFLVEQLSEESFFRQAPFLSNG
jgi:putative NADH-flavin reductase